MSDALDAYIYCLTSLLPIQQRKEGKKVEYFTRTTMELLKSLEKETYITWGEGESPTTYCHGVECISLKNNPCIKSCYSLSWDKKRNYDDRDYLELTNDSFVKYVKSVVGERKKQKTIYNLECGDFYYYITSDGIVTKTTWRNSGHDFKCLSIGNIYLTQEDAEKALDKLKATAKVKKRIAELNDGWMPDWNNNDDKWYIYYQYEDSKLDFDWYISPKVIDSSLYLKFGRLAERLIEEMPNELKTMLEVE